ncbi:hypothetical protein [Rahnella sp. Larv3_ips]|uniref:hypothetical protein n=1 Tax=Rahnella sp. Larv3_ips TaxID=1896943 RepID=UPI0013CE94E0|nr:hypothetical protein [Rahnella sp. Larv3_ips]
MKNIQAEKNPARPSAAWRSIFHLVTNSSFAANSAIAALSNTSTKLSKLQLAFIGSKSDAGAVRSVVEAKGGKFLHSTPNGS